MLNPYQPTLAENRDQVPERLPDRYRFAGLWLIGAGIIHFVGLNAALAYNDFKMNGDFSRFSPDWSPKLMILLGVLVLYRFRLAAGFTRLIGSFFVSGIVILPFCLLIPGSTGNNISIYRLKIDDPAIWQYVLIIGSVAAAILPPWWALQRAVAEQREPFLKE